MEYTLSVYLPEVALQNEEVPSKEELCKQAGINPPPSESSAPLLVQLLRQLKNQALNNDIKDFNDLSDFKVDKKEKVQQSAVIPDQKNNNMNIIQNNQQ